MFDMEADARLTLGKRFDPPRIEMLVSALVPAIAFEPVPGQRLVIGGTRIGGTPDLPTGLAWPKPDAPADIDAFVGRSGSGAADELRAHFKLDPPYAFFAQVDLGEAAALGPVAAALPGQGRLLFFYDLMAGPYDTGVRAGRVIWDRAPREELAAQAMPAALAEAAARYREATADFRAKTAGTPYDGPARAMRLKATLRLPSSNSLELESATELKALYDRGLSPGDDGFREAYLDVLARRFDPHYDAANSGRRQQLLGSPQPEQDDPRYDAVVAADFGVQHLGSDDWKARFAEISERAKGWRLLLQVDVADFMQERGEGTVYFLIRKGDLAERRFDKVVVVYQQT